MDCSRSSRSSSRPTRSSSKASRILVTLHVPHPHGGRAVSVGERQLVAVREKARLLEAKLRELVRFGEDNDAIGEKVHRLSPAGGRAPPRPLLDALYLHLRDHFAVPHVAVRVWGVARMATVEFSPVDGELRDFVETMGAPVCGRRRSTRARYLPFREARPSARSRSCRSCRRLTIGVLALACEDPQRFYPEMGTLYLAPHRGAGEPCAVALRDALA